MLLGSRSLKIEPRISFIFVTWRPPDLGVPLLPPGLDQAEGRADDAEHERQQHQRRRDHLPRLRRTNFLSR